MELKIYLDESGNPNTATFTIAGFYVFSSKNPTEIEIINKNFKNFLINKFELNKLKRKFQNIQKNIKKGKENFPIDAELKWVHLGKEFTKYLFENIPNMNQKHFGITADVNSWKETSNRNSKFDIFYNYLIKVLIFNFLDDHEELIKLLKENNLELNIEIFVDDRSKDIRTVKSLEQYLQAESLESLYRENINFRSVHYQNSFDNWAIQYADYIAGLYNSYGKIMLNSENEKWVYNKEIYINFHTKYICLKCQNHPSKVENVNLICNKKLRDLKYNFNDIYNKEEYISK